MHEMSICQALLDQVERIAQEQRASQVDSIVLSNSSIFFTLKN